MKFKNLRRPTRATKAGIIVSPVKKTSSEPKPKDDMSCVEELERHIAFLKRSYNSKKWSLSSMLSLMEQTAYWRREWIKNEGPSVQQVLENFPCLADPRLVSLHYFHVESSFGDLLLCMTKMLLCVCV